MGEGATAGGAGPRRARIRAWDLAGCRGRRAGRGVEGWARAARPSLCTLPITALRVTPPSALAICEALSPDRQRLVRVSTRASVQPRLGDERDMAEAPGSALQSSAPGPALTSSLSGCPPLDSGSRGVWPRREQAGEAAVAGLQGPACHLQHL